MKLKPQALVFPLEKVKTAGKKAFKNFCLQRALVRFFFFFQRKRPLMRPFKCVKEIFIFRN